ncbi:hypothetical protein OG21DRAFT_1527511 [Imleria badia]|nr:hypothetical protein OG21DRAFT_1527511 [Imleria badia]
MPLTIIQPLYHNANFQSTISKLLILLSSVLIPLVLFVASVAVGDPRTDLIVPMMYGRAFLARVYLLRMLAMFRDHAKIFKGGRAYYRSASPGVSSTLEIVCSLMFKVDDQLLSFTDRAPVPSPALPP